MRHVSRTHRVALDWFFDRINLDQKNQIKYIDTKNQLADILTKGNFTRDEWNHLLCLSDICHFSSTVCSEVMSKRTQKESGEERATLNSCHLRPQKARGRKVLKVRVLGVRKLRTMIERRHPLLAVTKVTSQCTTTNNWLEARTQHATRGGAMTWLGLLESGKLMKWWMIERGNPLFCPRARAHAFQSRFSLLNTSTLFWWKKTITIERWHPLFALKEEQGHNNSLLETTKQNWICR